MNDRKNITQEEQITFDVEVVEVVHHLTIMSNPKLYIRRFFNFTNQDNFAIVKIETDAINNIYGQGSLTHDGKTLYSFGRNDTKVLDGGKPMKFQPPNRFWAGHIHISFIRTRESIGSFVNISNDDSLYQILLPVMPLEYDDKLFIFNAENSLNISEDSSSCTYVNNVS